MTILISNIPHPTSQNPIFKKSKGVWFKEAEFEMHIDRFTQLYGAVTYDQYIVLGNLCFRDAFPLKEQSCIKNHFLQTSSA